MGRRNTATPIDNPRRPQKKHPFKLCAVCGITFWPAKPTGRTCSAKCRNADTARRTAEKRGDSLRGRALTVDERSHKRVVRPSPMKSGNGRTYAKLNGRHEHRQVAERKIGRALLPGEIVHHVDGNKRNNHPDNLEVMTQSEHLKIHLPDMRARFRDKLRKQRESAR